MSEKTYVRKAKEDRPVLAICYDFDKTLSPDDMQAQGYIQSVGYEDKAMFWAKSNRLAEENDMDQNLAYMYMMKEAAEGKVLFTKDQLLDYGAGVSLFPGVETWFSRIRNYGRDKGVMVEHYVISSGLKEMIEGTAVAHEFEKIYASSFYFNEKGVAVWPAQAVNYTNKTQFLFRIEKGVLDINDPGVNEYFAPEDMRVPFRNMVYIGDSDTDIPCMKLVNAYGGHSIGVFNAETKDKTKVYKMMRDQRIKYFAEADYSEGKTLDALLKAIIDRTASNEILENMHYHDKRDFQASEEAETDKEKYRKEAIVALEESGSFATTHRAIAKLLQYEEWSRSDAEKLLEAARNNSQIRYILQDSDVHDFYQTVLDGVGGQSALTREIASLLQAGRAKSELRSPQDPSPAGSHR